MWTLQRWTNYTQLGGALLIAMGVIQGWLACATLYNPVPGFSPGWAHAIAIIQRDWLQLVPIFMMEYTYGQSLGSSLDVTNSQLQTHLSDTANSFVRLL